MKVKCIICAACLALCCGCWDKNELENQTFAVMLGVDRAESGNVEVTVLFPLTQTGGGGAKAPEEYSAMSAVAPTVAGAMDLFDTKLAGSLSVFSVKTVVISEELARDEALKRVVSSWRYERMGSNTNILVSDCKASDFIAARRKDAVTDILKQEDLLLEQANHSACYKAVQFLDFIVRLGSKSEDAIAMYGGVSGTNSGGPGDIPVKAENKSLVCGVAVFSGGRMTGALDLAEAQTLALMTKGKTQKIMTLQDPAYGDGKIAVIVQPNRGPRIRTDFLDGVPVFEISAALNCAVEAADSGAGYVMDADYDLLGEYIEKACEQEMNKLVSKLQKEFDADILGLGDKLSRNFATTREWERYDWKSRYRDAVIRVNVDLSVNQ